MPNESAYFLNLRKACHSRDPKAALDSLTVWLGSCCTQSQFATVKEFTDQLCNDELTENVVALQEAVASHSTEWSGNQFYLVVVRVRRKLLKM